MAICEIPMLDVWLRNKSALGLLAYVYDEMRMFDRS